METSGSTWRLMAVSLSLETKYRDIADGNKLAHFSWAPASRGVGNQVPRYSGWKQIFPILHYRKDWAVRTQVPRYSGFKTGLLIESDRFIELLSSVVFIANAWNYALRTPNKHKSRTIRRLDPWFSSREDVHLVEFGTDTRNISKMLVCHKSRQTAKSHVQQVYWQPKARLASAISPLHGTAETLSLTAKSATSLFFYKSL